MRDEMQANTLGGMSIEQVQVSDQAHYPITLRATPGQQLQLELCYYGGAPAREAAQHLLQSIQMFLDALASDPERPTGQLVPHLPSAVAVENLPLATVSPAKHTNGATRAVRPPRALVSRLTETWREVLGRDTVARDISFFAMGGHAPLALYLAARLAEVFEVDVPVSEIYRYPTLTQQARYLAKRLDAGRHPSELKAVHSNGRSGGTAAPAEPVGLEMPVGSRIKGRK